MFEKYLMALLCLGSLFCALGWRSALATKSLVDMGFKNVAHVSGGFDALKKSGLKVVVKDKK